MKRYLNERTLQVLLCLMMAGVAIVTWRFTHSAFLIMAACVGFTGLWLGIGFWSAHFTDRNTGA